jgi:hypothetical protein
MSITSKVLLATVGPPRCSATKWRLASTEDQTHTDTHAVPWRNSVIAGWGNYVIVNPSHWGNYLIADSAGEDGVERGGELAVPIADEEPEPLGGLAEIHQQVAAAG